ncbi:hypothetical protein E4U53_007705, partial [Claviceps sorghi]
GSSICAPSTFSTSRTTTHVSGWCESCSGSLSTICLTTRSSSWNGSRPRTTTSTESSGQARRRRGRPRRHRRSTTSTRARIRHTSGQTASDLRSTPLYQRMPLTPTRRPTTTTTTTTTTTWTTGGGSGSRRLVRCSSTMSGASRYLKRRFAGAFC